MESRHIDEFLRLVRSPLRFNFFLLCRLPAAFIAGVRLRRVDPVSAVSTVPFQWLSQNPFRSIYFACLAMSAELSTGILAMLHLHGRKPAVSMLVTHIEADFVKKAASRISFTCADGEALRTAIEESVATGLPTTCTATSVGRNAAGETVSTFRVTWSFKARSA